MYIFSNVLSYLRAFVLVCLCTWMISSYAYVRICMRMYVCAFIRLCKSAGMAVCVYAYMRLCLCPCVCEVCVLHNITEHVIFVSCNLKSVTFLSRCMFLITLIFTYFN